MVTSDIFHDHWAFSSTNSPTHRAGPRAGCGSPSPPQVFQDTVSFHRRGEGRKSSGLLGFCMVNADTNLPIQEKKGDKQLVIVIDLPWFTMVYHSAVSLSKFSASSVARDCPLIHKAQAFSGDAGWSRLRHQGSQEGRNFRKAGRLVVNIWLVVWLPFFTFPFIGFLIIPPDFHIFQRGG